MQLRPQSIKFLRLYRQTARLGDVRLDYFGDSAASRSAEMHLIRKQILQK